jgi:predicted esterase
MERSIAATIHGRYLLEHPPTTGPTPLIVGFHGYAENAEIQMERLAGNPGGAHWTKLSIQGLHRFYQRRTNLVVSSWMTSQDRDAAIADNVAYVRGCVDAVAAECGGVSEIVFAGFSQGVAMAFRSAACSRYPVAGVIAQGGDVPPELTPEQLRKIPAVVITRGSEDAWYTALKMADDERRLREAGVRVKTVEFDGGHEWFPIALDHFNPRINAITYQ